MKLTDLLNENDAFVVEMANFLADVTDLPANIVLWTRTQPEELPHNKYRIKVFKDRIHCATYTIGEAPRSVWVTGDAKQRLDSYEEQEAMKVISVYSPLFIQYVDGKINADDAKHEIKKIRGQV
jgi:hypothetical protein